MKSLFVISLFLMSCETSLQKQARENDRKVDSILRQMEAETNQLDREIRLIEAKK